MYRRQNNFSRYRSQRNRHKIERAKFYQHLRTYLAVNGLVLFFGMQSGMIWGFWPMTLIWGMGVYNHYKKVFLNEEEPPQYLDESREEMPLKTRKKAPAWRDKDLV